MTTTLRTQIQICKDAITGMKQAQSQGNKETFDLHKEKLTEVLEVIKTLDKPAYTKFSTYLDMKFD